MKSRGPILLLAHPRRNPSRLDLPAALKSRNGKSSFARQLLQARSVCFLALVLWLSIWGMGCRLVKTVAEVPVQTISAFTPGKSNQPAANLADLQQTLMRYADNYLTRISLGIDQLKRGTNAATPIEVLQWKIGFATSTLSIASGPNAVANTLDMTVFATLIRNMVENYWIPNVFGESARPLLTACQNDEKEIWRIANTILTQQQKDELRQSIETWQKANPLPESVLAARALGLASEVTKATRSTTTKSSGVLDLLRIDPLAGLDPATREIAETRLFAERALFIAQQMPTVIRWQVELMTLTTLAQPAVTQFVTNTTQVSDAVNRLVTLTEQLPGQIATEREAIVKTLEAQEAGLTGLSSDVRQTVVAGTQMSTSLNTTLTTFTELMRLFGVGDTNQPPPNPNAPPAAPFNILDYAKTAAQLEVTAKELTVLVNTLDQTLASTNLAKLSAQVSPVVQQAEVSSRQVVDYTFWKGLLLVGLALVAALLYRFAATRWLPNTGKKNSE